MKYVRMKSAIIDAERKHGLHELDVNAREILQTLADATLTNKNIRISTLREQQIYGTLPTILTKLQKLVDGGWIERKQDLSDKRAVLLNITPKTVTVFKRISKLLDTF